VEVWQTSNLRRLRLGEETIINIEDEEEEEGEGENRRNYTAKI